ncbi:PTS sugar transporter subunit IIB [Celerinatantimonas sp. YJH-8]|uniref:PTS sugar transporter subunit IIB n=1 Tax=Celerinatantimonas sp. YJH-8 TaxID=3228714 RepID=UPI0038C80578
MYRLMLCCSAGMSTSLLVKKMKDVAEQKGIAVSIDAYSVAEFDEQVSHYQAVLLGPQVKYLQADLARRASPYGVPVETINPMDYGMQNGEHVLEQGLALAGTEIAG